MPVLSDEAVTFFSSISVNSKQQFLSCASIAFSKRFGEILHEMHKGETDRRVVGNEKVTTRFAAERGKVATVEPYSAVRR